jgi:hypothetical protein
MVKTKIKPDPKGGAAKKEKSSAHDLKGKNGKAETHPKTSVKASPKAASKVLVKSGEKNGKDVGSSVSNTAKRAAIFAGKIKEMGCDVCGVVAGRDFVGEWKSSEQPKDVEAIPNDGITRYWLRCQNCDNVELVEEWKIQVNRDKILSEISVEDCIPYTPQGIYRVGDAIFHALFKQMGIVRSKQITSSGASAITVEFNSIGTRQLLENVSIDSHGTVSAPGKKGKMMLKKSGKR